MSEDLSGTFGEPTTVISSGETGPQSVADAVRSIEKGREAAYAPPKKEEESPVEATPPPEEKTDAPPEEAPVDTTQEAEPAEELPPVEPPRSWTKDEKDEFATYPRDAQEKIARREQEREAAIRRSQNEAAERRKALDIERQQTAQVRQQYEQTLPNLLQAMDTHLRGSPADGGFSDIRTWADVERLQADDPFRYQRYDLAIKKAQAVRQELAGIQQRQSVETSQRWNEFAKTEDAKFTELVPDAADPTKLKSLQEKAARTLKNIGFSDQDIDAAWKGKTGISMRDHHVQLLIHKATLWDEAQAKARTVRQSPLPPVIKPGTARNSKGDAAAAEIKSLENQQKTAKGTKAIDIGVKLLQARRRAAQ